MSDLDKFLQEEMENPEFAKAWEDSELEDQIKRLIINARIKYHLTQKQLAEMSGVRQSNISRIEKGRVLPTLATLNALAKALGKQIRIELV